MLNDRPQNKADQKIILLLSFRCKIGLIWQFKKSKMAVVCNLVYYHIEGVYIYFFYYMRKIKYTVKSGACAYRDLTLLELTMYIIILISGNNSSEFLCMIIRRTKDLYFLHFIKCYELSRFKIILCLYYAWYNVHVSCTSISLSCIITFIS